MYSININHLWDVRTSWRLWVEWEGLRDPSSPVVLPEGLRIAISGSTSVNVTIPWFKQGYCYTAVSCYSYKSFVLFIQTIQWWTSINTRYSLRYISCWYTVPNSFKIKVNDDVQCQLPGYSKVQYFWYNEIRHNLSKEL